jgi:hypothetical protein
MVPNAVSLPGELSWRVARRCDGGTCVQIGKKGDLVLIGDSKDPDGPVLAYSRAEWRTFAEGIKQGDFDDLL